MAVCTPPRPSRRNSITETSIPRVIRSVPKGIASRERNVIPAPVPHRSKHHAVGGDSRHEPNRSTRRDVDRPVIRVGEHGASKNKRGERRREQQQERPQRRLVVGEDFELGVEVQRHKGCSSEGGGRVSRGE